VKALLGAILAFACATPAHANWEGFEWRMSEAEVETAKSDVEVYRLEEVKRKRMRPSTSPLGGKWTDDGQDYQVFFYFDPQGELEFIEIEPVGVDCAEWNDLFAERHGKFEEEISPLGPATRTTRYWKLSRGFELNTLVLHFESSGKWNCNARIRNPTPWLNR
jgi:hypothetical protein